MTEMFSDQGPRWFAVFWVDEILARFLGGIIS